MNRTTYYCKLLYPKQLLAQNTHMGLRVDFFIAVQTAQPIQMGWASRAVWAAIKKYRLNTGLIFTLTEYHYLQQRINVHFRTNRIFLQAELV